MTSWKLLALASAFFAGLTAILSKIGVKDISPNLATFVRTTVIMGLLALLVAVRGEWRGLSALPNRGLLFLALSGLSTGASWLCYFHALQRGPASLVAPLDKLSLIFAVVLSVLFLGEALSRVQWVGVGLMALGACLVAVS